MVFKSFLRFFGRKLFGRKQKRHHARRSSSFVPRLEALETRELLTGTIPTILGSNPIDGSSTPTGTPLIQVTYSEPMGSSALVKSNYLLFGSGGNRITINSASFDSLIPNTVNLAYNSNQPLVVDTYSLYV